MANKKTQLNYGIRAILFLAGLSLLFACRTVEERPESVKPVKIPKKITQAVKKNPQENLELLVSFIEDNSETPSEMFRYAHDWTAQNIPGMRLYPCD